MTETDGQGRNWSYLANEDNFKLLKDLQGRNLVIPIVGDFAGPKAIRAVAQYLEEHEAPGERFLYFERRAIPLRGQRPIGKPLLECRSASH